MVLFVVLSGTLDVVGGLVVLSGALEVVAVVGFCVVVVGLGVVGVVVVVVGFDVVVVVVVPGCGGQGQVEISGDVGPLTQVSQLKQKYFSMSEI